MVEQILGYLGLGLMFGLAAVGSSYGTTIAASAAEGALKINPDKSTNYLVLSSMPATQGLYGFVAFLMWLTSKVSLIETQGLLMFGVGVSVGLVCLLSAIRQGQVCAAGIVGISHGHDVLTNTMIYAALPEFYAILALVASLMV